MDEFARIQAACFTVEIASHLPDSGHVLHYSSTPKNGLSVFHSGCIEDFTSLVWEQNLYFFESTHSDRESFIVPFDLFWNAFVLLSRLEEYRLSEGGQPTRSYAGRHSRTDQESFAVPMVNRYFDRLERLIGEHFPDLEFGAGAAPIVELSHDVDYVEKTLLLRLKQSAVSAMRLFRQASWPSQKELQVIFSNESCWCFDQWEELEKSQNARSVFYVYVKSGEKNWRERLVDPGYDIASHPHLLGTLHHLKSEGFEIGLHGSLGSAGDPAKLKQEKEKLEELLGFPVEKSRQHWLNYDENVTPQAHAELFAYDSTLGWNDRIGFRSGIASRYHPYDHDSERAWEFFETPLLVMDSQIYYHADKEESALKQAEALVCEAKSYKNSHFSLSWHQRVCSPDYGWTESYQRLAFDL